MHINLGKYCNCCDILEEQNRELRAQNKELIDRILLLTQPSNQVLSEKINTEEEHKPIKPIGGFRTMRAHRRALEEESARAAQIATKKIKDNMMQEIPVDNNVSELEKELGIENGNIQ